MKLIEKLKMESIFWLARRQPTCRELAPWMSEALDGRLSPRRRLTLKLHFMICAWCRRYQQQLLLLQAAYRRQAAPENDPAPPSDQPLPRLSDEARERMRRALSQNER